MKLSYLTTGLIRVDLLLARRLLRICFVLSVIGCAHSIVSAQSAKPILVSTPNSTRALALDAVSFTPEPFPATTTSFLYGTEKSTRVMLFTMNLSLKSGEDASAVTADAEDAAHHHYNLKVEYVGKIPGQEWLSHLNLRLDESMGDLGDVLIRITYQGIGSNRVRVGIGHVGGGPLDDPGAAPTPAPPYTISGRITSDTSGLSGVTVSLTGSQTGTTVTDNNGDYSFTVTSVGDYTITPSKNFYAITPSGKTFNNLSGNQTANFSGALLKYSISGYVFESNGNPLRGATVTLGGALNRVATTGGDGSYTFTELPAGSDYTLTLSLQFYNLDPQKRTFNSLSGNQTAANFAATRKTYAVNGQILDDHGKALDDVSVTVKSLEGDSWTSTVTTSGGGIFAFTALPAGYRYLIAPSSTSLFTFAQQSTGQLDGDVTLNFSGTLRHYTIGGKITDRSHHGVGGVSVTLSGALNLSATTDAGGNYSFTNLPAGKNYNVVAAKTDYTLSPDSQAYNLVEDVKADFTAIRFYRISGRVTDNSGRGIFGIWMSLSGPETNMIHTGSDGSYSYIVTTTGDYTLTPLKQQSYYQFSPSSLGFSLNTLSNHQTVNFTGALSISGPTYVLEFDGSPRSVDYGYYWPQSTNVGHFFWEFWAVPGEGNIGRYMLSDGYGGGHTLLFGFNYGPRGYSLFGNVWNGSGVVYFYGDDGPSPGEWGHYAVGWDGKNIIVYYNGVPVGKQPFTGPRVSMSPGDGSTMLLMGGSDHQNFVGKMAQVRGFEENNPRESSPESSFVPQTIFSVDGQLLSYYFHPADFIADLSNGYNGSPHDGWPRGMHHGYFYVCPECPGPQFVLDPTAPDFLNPSNSVQIRTQVASPPATPGGARIFDSFSRDNSTYILGSKGGLGMTEAGAGGTKTWQTNLDPAQPQPFGILGGRAVLLADDTAMAWISTGASAGNLDVRGNRAVGTYGSGDNTGLCFRVIDKNNYFFAYTSGDEAVHSNPKKLTIGYYQSGVRTVLASGITMSPDNWTTLRVVTTQSGGINVYADSTLVYSTTSAIFASATGAGLFNNAPGMALTNRWDNFTVLDVP